MEGQSIKFPVTTDMSQVHARTISNSLEANRHRVPIDTTVIWRYVERMLCNIEATDYAGYDPYDALNSRLIRLMTRHSKWARMGVTQLLRRFPVNLRPLAGIAKGYNPKGLGLFLEGYSKLYSNHPKPKYRNAMMRLIDLLWQTRSLGYAGNCWGYNFPWQSRLVYRPPYMPTIVNTSFIGHGLLDAYEATGESRALEMAVSTKDFILRDLSRKSEGNWFCFSYSPGAHDYVHNANSLGASLLKRISTVTGDDELKNIACASISYTVHHQKEDGSWCFAEDGRSWVDSYHTGFILESLRHFLDSANEISWQEVYERGTQYYAKTFFLEDGTPKHYKDRIYPIDIHSAAEGVCFFSKEGVVWHLLTERILGWMFANMWDKKGFFYYRKNRLFTTKISYMRWSQAWTLRALVTYYIEQRKVSGTPS